MDATDRGAFQIKKRQNVSIYRKGDIRLALLLIFVEVVLLGSAISLHW